VSHLILRGRLDYLFARGQGSRMTSYERVSALFGSDHYPLIAWIHPPRSTTPAAAPVPTSPGQRRNPPFALSEPAVILEQIADGHGAGVIRIKPQVPDAALARLPHTLRALAAAAASHPFERKLIVCRRAGIGRELLRALPVHGVPWIGFEVSTPLRLAQQLVAPALAAQGLEVLDEFDEVAFVDAAMDSVLTGDGRLARLAEGSGLRQAIVASVRSLRLAGITAADIAEVRLRDVDKREQIAGILREYEQRLAAESRVDAAGVMHMALNSVADVPAMAQADHIYLLPDQTTRGLAGRFLAWLEARGAAVLPADPVFGMRRPTGWLSAPETPHPEAVKCAGAAPLSWLHDVRGWLTAAQGHHGPPEPEPGPASSDVVLDLFAASSVVAELREVLRRVVAAGLRWDEVEIIAADTLAYGVALDGLGRRLGIAVGHADGLPLARTRAGRAVAAYCEWVQLGYPADVLRQMLERGDVAPPGGTVSGLALARRLRSLKIGRGLDRYGAALARRETSPADDPATSAAGTPGGDPAASASAAATPEDAPAATPEDAPAATPEDAPAATAEDAPAATPEDAPAATAEDAPAATPEDAPAATPEDDASDSELAALAALLRPLIETAPRAGAGQDGRTPPAEIVAVAPADVARGLLAMLVHVPAEDAVERSARARMAARLQRLVQSVTRPTTLAGAIAAVQHRLDERVPSPESAGGSPWNAAGGHLHLAGLESGGYSGRRATFVVGLDSSRFPGTGGSDALLVDDDRARLGAGRLPAPLPTAAERVDERRYAFAALLARLRGRVTFSYAAWDAVEGRSLAPASELLQVHRLMSGDDAADYEALHDAVSPPASAVPRGGALLDGEDVWLNALAHDPAGGSAMALRRGVTVVCAAYPQLKAGVRAWKTRLRSAVPTAHHGVITPRPILDPRTGNGLVVSATRLQTLGACPHRYLLRYVLGVRVPADPDLSPEQWLQPLERGKLLHEVFERALRTAAERDLDLDDDVFGELVAGILDDTVTALRVRLPPPGAAVFEAERTSLQDDVRAFVAMVRQDGRRFMALERRFGHDADEPVDIALPDGSTIQLEGAIDRIDELDDGRLLIIDYKTGSHAAFSRDTGALDGGRRLQHVLYAAAASRLLGRDVAAVEYQFPTRRSENHRVRYDAAALQDGLGVVTDLLDLVRNGWFLPSNDSADCRFCDYASVCRVSTDAWGRVTSPLAEWSREADGAAADLLRRLRG
jgi:RecB family exonuclease